ncbi:MAG: carbohydrate porin [Steroidobacteraceae bacterium]
MRDRRRIYGRPRCALASAAAALAVGCAGAGSPAAHAETIDAPGAALATAEVSLTPDERFAVHGQATYVEQDTNSFRAPYRGPNSLSPDSGRETSDLTLYLGARLWHGAEIWVSAEIDQGFGLDNTVGLAAFSSGEAYKVGANAPYLRMPRLFVRQTLDTGTERENVEGIANQLAGTRSLDRWVFTVGKFSVTDVFDTNQYAHDPRMDFLNWAAVDAGTYDYAADAWAYTVGAAAERYIGLWTFRVGVFDLSIVPNSPHLDPAFHQFQMDGEIEKRYPLFGKTGRILFTAWDTRGRMGLLDQAIALGLATDTTPNTAKVRQYRSRIGGSFALEQPVTDDFGLFARVGKAQGNVEVYEFTDIDRSKAVGGSLKGTSWRRPGDTLGVVFLDDGISAEREEYLSLGGLGVLVGDGKLPHPGPEEVFETYYSIGVFSWAQLSADYQYVKNPAYNRDRGPVSIWALRLHLQF